MSNLSPEERKEVIEMMNQSHVVLIAGFKETLHEIIDPLKNDVNRALGNYDMLNNKVAETETKIQQLFIFHNNNEDKMRRNDLKILSIEKDGEKAESDLNSIGRSMRENFAKAEILEDVVKEAQASYTTLSRIGGLVLTLMALAIAFFGLKK